MGDLIKMMFEKDFFKKKIPVWHILIIACIAYAGWKLNALEAGQAIIGGGVVKANKTLDNHGEHLDRIDSALYYKFDIDTRSQPGTPRQRNSSQNERTNAVIAQIQQSDR